jgi:hypothetical protein
MTLLLPETLSERLHTQSQLFSCFAGTVYKGVWQERELCAVEVFKQTLVNVEDIKMQVRSTALHLTCAHAMELV